MLEEGGSLKKFVASENVPFAKLYLDGPVDDLVLMTWSPMKVRAYRKLIK